MRFGHTKPNLSVLDSTIVSELYFKEAVKVRWRGIVGWESGGQGASRGSVEVEGVLNQFEKRLVIRKEAVISPGTSLVEFGGRWPLLAQLWPLLSRNTIS